MSECKTELSPTGMSGCVDCGHALTKRTWKYCPKHRFVELNCAVCGKRFETTFHGKKQYSNGKAYDVKYCSQKCQHLGSPLSKKLSGFTCTQETRMKLSASIKRIWYEKLNKPDRLNAISRGVIAAWKEPEGKLQALRERNAEKRKLAMANFNCKVCGVPLHGTRTIRTVSNGKTYTYYYQSVKTLCDSCKYRSTSIEREMQEILTMLGVDWKKQFHISRFWVDLTIPSEKILIECDGSVFHKDIEEEKARDMKILLVLGHGWKMLHFGEAEIHRLYRNREFLTYDYLLGRGMQFVTY